MSRTKPLHDLQVLDQQRDTALDRLTRIEHAMGRAPAVVAAQTALAACEAALARVEESLAACQARRQTLKARLAAEEAQLYGGRTASAREIEGQKANLDAHQRQLSDLDDAALALMLERDAAADAAAGARRSVDEAMAAAEGTDAQLRAARTRLTDGLAVLGPRLEQARSQVAAADLALYDRLRADTKRGGVSVAKVTGEACGGCGRALTSAETQRAAAALTQCPACGRILHA
jgi:predicted  nucleic acid-binding Zn-ribbon protein